MTTSRKLTSALLALFALVMMSASALAADPGLVYPPTSEVSDQKAGSVLFYNYYTSGATSGNSQNTRINITNTSTTSAAFVHLFFVAASNCSVADSFICLTATQTASFLASDVDPGVSGYIVAVASSGVTGCPVAFNHLIGDEYIKTTTGHAANLGAEAFAALYNGVIPGCDGNSITATLAFNGVVGSGYNQAPLVLALSNIPSRADGNDTLVVLNRFGGNLAIGASTISSLFGLLYDDAENVFSFTLSSGACQLVGSISNTFPRTVPRVETVIPAGRSGWAKVWLASGAGLLGAQINKNENAGAAANAFNGGHNLHKLTLSPSNSYTIPIFPPSC
ncbi:MAG: hypothetical protein JMDDDDMK_00837 [Acidobacteria bacterium]|nr:hypothetical protein [Acidobacteriota bacterium]